MSLFDEVSYLETFCIANAFYINEGNMFRYFVNSSAEYIARGPPGNMAASAKAHIGVKQAADFVKTKIM